MQPNKKYANNGVQYAMYPNAVMNITQTINGYYSHRGTNAIDDAQADTGRDNGYAPCDMVCVATGLNESEANAVFWQSQAPVITRSHGTQYIHMMVLHDNTANAYVGMKIAQGQQLFTEGTAGRATGNHSHIEIALGKWGGTKYVRSGGLTAWGSTVYMMPNNINPSEVFFVDDTKIINGGGLNWGKIGTQTSTTSSYNASQLIKEHAKATFTNDTKITIHRDTPTGASYGSFVKGEVQEYTEKWIGNGHRYISWLHTNGVRCFAAVSGSETAGKDMWATFSSIGSNTEQSSSNDTISLIQEDGVATFTVDGVRAHYDSPTGDVCKTYNTGGTLRYYWKYVGHGHRYVVSKDGNRKVFVAVSATEDKSQMWATFSAPQEENKIEEPKKEEIKPAETPTEEIKEDTNGFSSVNEGEYEGHDAENEVLELDGVTVDLINKDLYPYKCPYLMTPKTIIIHNAATPNGTARALNNALHNSKEYKSWHFSVDDKDIIESLPLNRNAFGTGDGAFGLGNRTGVHIEIAKDNDTDSNEEWQKARANGAKLAAQLLYKYGFGIDKLTKHQDYKMTDGTYKYCPHKILDEGWDDFKALVESELKALKNPKKDDEIKPSESEPIPSEPKEDDKKDEVAEKPTEDKTTEDKKNTLLDLLIKLVKKILSIFK